MNQAKSESDFKLNALLEVTKAINNNFPVSHLLALYKDILQNRLGVGRLVLFSFTTKWQCILKYGLPDYAPEPEFEDNLLDIEEIETITYNRGELSKSFEIVIPVYHKKSPLAFVLLGDVNPDKIEISNAIKHLPYVQTLTNIIVVAIENKKLFKENIEKAQINKELELAQSMQQMLFPHDLPNTDSFRVSALYMPHQQVGGDYYDFIQLNNHEYIFCMADVSGKGLSAALLMSNLQATLQSLSNYTHNLKDIIIELNKRVIKNTNYEKFVSFFLGKINTKSQQLTYINAGHNAPLIYYDKKFISLSKGTTLLGIQENLRDIEVDIFNYALDLTLFCYTDGLTDTIDENKQSLSVEEIKSTIEKNNK
ncbi:MAG: SpoIIE family protein phosphatase, partial [Bacteroidia bacterium]|nr:SpoIIE family protein phosphatase [Bacteroidia bacterium]